MWYTAIAAYTSKLNLNEAFCLNYNLYPHDRYEPGALVIKPPAQDESVTAVLALL